MMLHKLEVCCTNRYIDRIEEYGVLVSIFPLYICLLFSVYVIFYLFRWWIESFFCVCLIWRFIMRRSMIYWFLSIGNYKFMKVTRYCVHIHLCSWISFSNIDMTNCGLFYVKRGIFVAGLREEIVASAEQVLELLAFGECKYLEHLSHL